MVQSASHPPLCIAEGVASESKPRAVTDPSGGHGLPWPLRHGAQHSSSALAYAGDIWGPGAGLETVNGYIFSGFAIIIWIRGHAPDVWQPRLI